MWVGVQDVVTPRRRQRLRSGFVNRIVVRMYLYASGVKEPVATALRDSEILFDLWKETFRVVVKGGTPRPGFPGAEAAQNRVYEAADLDEAIGYATKLRGVPVASELQISPDVAYRVAFVVDLNPISEALLEDVRRRLVRVPGQRRPSNIFGSFISIFVNPKVEDSEHRVQFRSQTFRREEL